MNQYFTIGLVAAAMLSMIGTAAHGNVFAQNITETYKGTDIENDNDNNNDSYKDCFKSNADFCFNGSDYIRNKNKNDNNNNHKTATITVVYGDVGSYYGKGQVVIKNLDTGKTLVNHKLNFAKQHHNQGPDCRVKIYTFDKSLVDKGDPLGIKVVGGGGSWTDDSGFFKYKKNLEMSIDLDEIGE